MRIIRNIKFQSLGKVQNLLSAKGGGTYSNH
jgi:hypothetical protein